MSAGLVGLEEDGLTTLANDTSELIAWVGDTTLRTFGAFSLKLQLERGWNILRGPEIDPADRRATCRPRHPPRRRPSSG